MKPFLSVLAQGSLLLLVVAGYWLASRRFRILNHPLVIVLAVVGVGVTVSVIGELVFRDGWTAVPAMARRSVVGSTFYGLLIAGAHWGVRKVLARRGH